MKVIAYDRKDDEQAEVLERLLKDREREILKKHLEEHLYVTFDYKDKKELS